MQNPYLSTGHGGAPYGQRPVTLLEPPTQMPMQSSANAYTDADTWNHRFSDQGKYADEPGVDETVMFADVNAPNSLEKSYWTRNGYRGIWLPEDRRAFQNQSLFMKILRMILSFLMIGIILTLCVLMLLFVFLRPPNIGMQNVLVPTVDDVKVESGTFQFNTEIKFVISNPNEVSATLKKVHAVAYDAAEQSIPIGSCTADDQVIAKKANTTLALPCELRYDANENADLSVIKDIATRCFETKQQLPILLKVHISFQLYSFSVPIDVSPTISIACPVTQQQVEKVLGKKLSDLGIGSSSRRSVQESLVQRLALPEAENV
ncbi:hypothetical protein MNAN1_002856 [Malassezia nana]|uniref:Uncharacterized protein n=1 Tax=Malassezia nana TaxID=180528 RepID=A0AAF0J8B2_9BASI|nr:hypothetical protein MNAN1_002856 [Malassezia nana]